MINFMQLRENLETPLHYCANNGEAALIRRLLEAGADPNAREKNGNTPLHFAAANCFGELARILLDYGAEGSVENNEGATPIDIANDAGCIDVVDLL